jgi:hypothetical protein
VAFDNSVFRFNGDATDVYSMTRVYGNGSSVTSDRQQALAQTLTHFQLAVLQPNTFGNSEYYIPNYTGSNFKSFLNDAVSENNGSTGLSSN